MGLSRRNSVIDPGPGQGLVHWRLHLQDGSEDAAHGADLLWPPPSRARQFSVRGWSEDAWDPALGYILMGSVKTTNKRFEVEVKYRYHVRVGCFGRRQLPADTAR